jgi:uncharacterized repeat protein (TIGR01451 family)
LSIRTLGRGARWALLALGASVVLAGTPGPLAAGSRAATGAATPRRPAAFAGVLTEQAKLTGTGDARGDADERFGSAVAVDGDTAVVGAPWHDLPGQNTGAAYVFVRTAGVWTLEAKLSPVGPPAVTGFGISVAVSGDTVVVGTQDYWSKAAYVFVRSGGAWTQQAQLVGSDTQSFDDFGAAVSVSGDTVVVGSPEDTTGFGSSSGSAYVFVRSGGVWTEQQKLLPADLAADDHFGQSVSVSGDSVVAGSPGDDTGLGINAGSAYVFVRSGAVWGQESKLTAPGGVSGDGFGSSVSMRLDAAAVGAPAESAGLSGVGAVHVFRRAAGVWSEEQRIVASGSSKGFGAAVALDTDTLVVGAPDESPEEYQSGAAYVFEGSGGVWTEEQRLSATVPQFIARFGVSVAVSGGAALAGEPGRDDGSGSALVFRGTGATWAEEARLGAPGTASFEAFGSAIAFQGDVLVVGAPDDNIPGERGAGSAYVFIRAGASWILQQKIAAGDASAHDRFGAGVALSGDTLVIAAPGALSGTGAAYVFVRAAGVWQPQQKLIAPSPYDEFGFAVSLDGDSLIVGAPGEDQGGAFRAGAAYVFVRTGAAWYLQQRLVSSPPANYANAGWAVALQGDTAIVGAPGSRKVLAFRRTAGLWAQEGALVGSGGAPADGFGRALALSTDTLIVGSPYAEVDGVSDAGAAYVFVRSGGLWTQQQKLVEAEPQYYAELGAAVAVSGDTALAGSDAYAYLSQGGYALLFERTGASWAERQRIAAFDGAYGDHFGSAVALSGGTAAVGAPGATTATGFASGAVYVLVPATADLALGFTGSPGSVVQGDLVTHTIVVTNNGSDAAPAVGVSSSLDTGLVVESVSASQGGCTPAASSMTCDVGVVPAGASATVTVVAVAVNVGVFTSQASILWAGSDPVPGNDSASTSTTIDPGGPADVSVTKSGPSDPATVGANLYYEIQVKNLGPSTAAGVEVVDPTPPGLTMLGTFGVCTTGFPCKIPRIPAGESRTISATFAIPASYPGPDPVVNTATVTAATPDPVPSNNTSTVETPFFVPAGTLDFYTLTPCRLLDTRSGSNPFAAGSLELVFPALGPCGVPYGARAVAVNVTVTQASAPGNLRLYPMGMPVPLVSTINYGAGQTRGNNAVVSLSSYGVLAVKVVQASGTVHVIIDVFGYFE